MTRSLNQKIKAKSLYQRAEKHWAKGQLRAAFRDFLAAAKAGSVGAFGIVGYFYHDGVGVKRNRDAALYWYEKSSRHGDDSSANNIGVILRDRGKLREAIAWFRKAVKLGSPDSNLNIAHIYLRNEPNLEKAVKYLRLTCRARTATRGSREEARNLLNQLRESRP